MINNKRQQVIQLLTTISNNKNNPDKVAAKIVNTLRQNKIVNLQGQSLLNAGYSTFIDRKTKQAVPMFLRENGLFTDGERDYMFDKKDQCYKRLNHSIFKVIIYAQQLSIAHHQLDWSIIWDLNSRHVNDNVNPIGWDPKLIHAFFYKSNPSLNALKLKSFVNSIFVGYCGNIPVFLKIDGWFSGCSILETGGIQYQDFWPLSTNRMIDLPESKPYIFPNGIKCYSFELYEVVGDKFKAFVGLSKKGVYNDPDNVLKQITVSSDKGNQPITTGQEQSLKHHFCDAKLVKELQDKFSYNEKEKFKNDNINKENLTPEKKNDIMTNQLKNALFLGIGRNSKNEYRWVFLKTGMDWKVDDNEFIVSKVFKSAVMNISGNGWFSDGVDDYWPTYELFPTKNGELFFMFEHFNYALSITPRYEVMYNMNFNNPGKSMYFITGTALFTGYDYVIVANTLFTSGLQGFVGLPMIAAFFTVAKPVEILELEKERNKKREGGKKGKTRKIKNKIQVAKSVKIPSRYGS